MSRARLHLGFAFGALAAIGCSSTISTVERPAELGRIELKVELEKDWSTSVSGEEESGLMLPLAPASDGQRVYLAGRDGQVEARELADGDQVWRIAVPRLTRGSEEGLGLWKRMWRLGDRRDQRLSAGPALGGGLLITGSSDGEVAAISAADGKLLWNVVVGSEVAAIPATDGSSVVVRLGNGQTVTLDARTGAVRWISEQPVPALSMRGAGRPLIDGGRVFAGFDNGKVVAFDLASGQTVWEAPLALASGRSEIERLVDADGVLQLVEGELFASAFHGRVASLDVESGRPLWQRELSSVKGLGLDAVAVYVTDSDSQVWALDKANGGPLWTQADLRARVLTAPVLVGGALLVGDLDGYVHALDPATGRIVGRRNVGASPIVVPPLAIGDRAVVQTASGSVAVLRIEARSEPRG